MLGFSTPPPKGSTADEPAIPFPVTSRPSSSFSSSLKFEPLVIPNEPGVFAGVVRHVFSPEECQQIISHSETQGTYEAALVNVGGGQQISALDYRNSSRAIIDDATASLEIWKRIKDVVDLTAVGGSEDWRPVGLNERLRYLRYDAGQYFKPHMDGCYECPQTGRRSFVTLQLYLNNGLGVDFTGGATTFISDELALNDPPQSMRSKEIFTPCNPEAGMVLVFQHRLYHEGTAVDSGRKYAIRTDVMYEPL